MHKLPGIGATWRGKV